MERTEYPSARLAALSVAQRALVILFVAVGIWYLSWRPATFNPDAMAFSAIVYAAELFGFTCALLYLYMCWRLQTRRSLPAPVDATVAVFVPTINESVDIVRRTVMAAMRMKHTTEVWLLDDGNRAAMRELAREAGCRYLARTENSHAKAGNLNNALVHTDAEFIAIFDADHAPAPTFLEQTLGFFSDQRVAFVQTPQDFYNLDSFQHRLKRGNSLVWSEQSLFFRVIQPGKDRLDSAFFCGSCAVVRRKALDDIGGFATGTVTEDIHTSILMHKHGWSSVYYGQSLAFGLAPSTAVPFLKQRLRWGQGAMQMWRKEGILFSRGLTLKQRLSYLATVLAYFEGWQRAIFFTSPVIVLTTGIMPILAMDYEFMTHFIPYYLLTFWVFEEVARGYGRTTLTEQYTMIRFAVFVTATFGFFLRKLRFVVTPKKLGEAVNTRQFLWPQYLVLALNAVAIPVGIFHFWRGSGLPTGALVANLLWAALTLGMAALAIGFATRLAGFRRREYRFPLAVPVRVASAGRRAMTLATDLSPLGFRLTGFPAATARVGDLVRGELLLPGGRLDFEALVRSRAARDGDAADTLPVAGCEFRWASAGDCYQLEQFLFGSDLQWRLNGLEDRTRTPLERLDGVLNRDRRNARALEGLRWSPLVYECAGAGSDVGVGFISAGDAGAKTRMIATLGSLPAAGQLHANEVTSQGLRSVQGHLSNQSRVDTHTAPIYLYRLTA